MQKPVPAEIIQQVAQEERTNSENISFCKGIKQNTEDLYAKYTLKKEIIPITRWYLEDKDGNQINLCIGDQIEYIDLEQSFDFKNNYVGTIRGVIADLEPKYIKLATPIKYYYLMGEGNKVFEIYRPLIENSDFQQSSKVQRTVSIVILLFILLLIVCGFMVM